ncbi:uncharacterized protein [Cicer arietinum]|uniref:Uncharacterized protein LOC101491617 isoform X2 n=1 Tax=Cicer arietinum TaxID=3827 RepID=A0A1S3ED31_CICAR|nr:uncharacterized protein LOC101491617 isoform X2 [Cicer arietinum]
MFVKKLVEKASIYNKPGGSSFDGLKASDVNPRVVFHQGIPSGGAKFAYDTIQKILALSTKDGRIKLYGKDNSQAMLESSEPLSSKFLQFIQNQGILLNVTSNNLVEVWDIEKKLLSDLYISKEEITSFAVIQHSLYVYIGHSNGNISVLKLDQNPWHMVQMKYTIPLSASYGNSEVSDDTTVMHILPQPAAESKRVLIIFRNGQIILWDIHESRTTFRTGGNMLQSSLHNETKKVTSACWTCPFGSKVAVGYNNGELFIWSIPSLNIGNGSASSDYNSQNTPLLKLNLGYKSEKISIGSIKWLYAGGKASRLYVMGASDYASSNLLQVVLLNEHTESRTIKLGLLLSECCVDMEIISTSTEQGKYKQDSFVLLGKSGHVYLYDDTLIERYLLQCQSKSTPSLPKNVIVKLPLTDSSITTAKFISNNPNVLYTEDEYYKQLVKNHPLFVPAETNQSSAKFSGFSKVQNLYITGHSNGAVNFWDASCPHFTPILQLKQQSENDFSLSGIPLTSLYFDINSPLLVSGDQSGMVRVFRFKLEPYVTNIFSGTKKGTDHIIQSVKTVKINGAIISVNIDHSSTRLAVGSDQGHVSVFNMDGLTLLYQKHIASEISSGVISLQFLTCSLHGFDKNILAVGTKDSSVLALDKETGNMLSTGTVHPKKPSKALFMQVFDGQGEQLTGSITKDGLFLSEGNHTENATTKQLYILLCSEKALYVYSLTHAIQGVKKVLHKKKFQSSSCCWASTFYGPFGVGLVLLFADGRVELRSLPELSMIVETTIRGFIYSPPKSKSYSDWQICCSSKGDLVLVNGNQEIFAVSLLVQRNIFRILDSVSCIYRKEMMLSQEELVPSQVIHKEKKKGIFSSVIKDFSGSKEKHVPPMETEDSRESIQELSVIFSNENFPCDVDNNDNLTIDEDEVELNIDDIDLDDHVEKRKDHGILGALNKKKLTGKFQALKGRLKEMKGNIQKTSVKEEQQEEQPGTVDQIKKRYGLSSSSNETSVAKLAESKLQENLKKLQGINLRTTEMQETAKSFSSLANQVLRTAEQQQDKRS